MNSKKPGKLKNNSGVPAAFKHMQDPMQLLGIPEAEATPAVRFAVSALIERLDDMAEELDGMRSSLATISQLVDIDCLAPIPNRRAFMHHLTWAIAMLERYGHTSSILFIDLNDFKKINDTLGHAAGDIAILHVSHTLSGMMRESDFIARIGGDEFGIVMYHADNDAAHKRGRKIVDTLTKQPFEYMGHSLTVSAAFGCYTIQEGDDANKALAAADQAMYEDKRRLRQDA